MDGHVSLAAIETLHRRPSSCLDSGAGGRINTNTRIVATTGRILAPIRTGSNEYRSVILPIARVEAIVPIPAAAPLIPLTVATVRLGNRSAWKVRPIVDQAAYEKVDIANRAISTGKLDTAIAGTSVVIPIPPRSTTSLRARSTGHPRRMQ